MCDCMCASVCVYSYVDKLTEFVRLFVSVHLPRIEHNSQFPVIEFLAVLFKYTFQQVDINIALLSHWPHAGQLWGCKNRPAPFPGRMSYTATKPGLVLFYILACFNCIVAY